MYDINLVSELPTLTKRLYHSTKIVGIPFGKMESNRNLTKSSPTKPSVILAREDSQVGNTRKLKSDSYLTLKLMVNEKDILWHGEI